MKKILSILLLLCMIVCALAACGGDGQQGETPTYESGALTNYAEYTLIYPDAASREVSEALASLRTGISDKYGVALPMSSDFLIPGEEAPVGTLEILIGATNRPESQELLQGLRFNDVAIRFINNRLVIAGGSDAKTAEAVQYFLAHFMGAQGLLYPEGQGYFDQGDYIVDQLTVGGVNISEFTIVRGKNVTADEYTLMQDLQYSIAALCGYRLPIVDASEAPTAHEILIGDTGREESSYATEPNTFSLVQSLDHLAVFGDGPKHLTFVLRYLIEDVLAQIPAGESYDISLTDITNQAYAVPTLTGTNLPATMQDLNGKYDLDFRDNSNVLERFYITMDELPDEVTVLDPIRSEDYPLSARYELYVSPDGNDKNTGTKDAPLATAKEAVKRMDGSVGGIIYFREGTYVVTDAVNLTARVGGTVGSPLFLRAYEGEEVLFTTARSIPTEAFEKITASDPLASRLSAEVRAHVQVVDLFANGWTASDIVAPTRNFTPKLYLGEETLTLARYPNADEPELYFDTVYETGSVTNAFASNLYNGWIARVESGEFDHLKSQFFTDDSGNANVNYPWTIAMVDKTPCDWVNTGRIFYKGCVFEHWHPETFTVASMDKYSGKMTSVEGSTHGAKHSTNSPTGYNTYYLYNAIEALDSEGEWFLDPDTGRLYVYSDADLSKVSMRYAAKDNSVFNLKNGTAIVMDGFTFAYTVGTPVIAEGMDQFVVQNCKFRNTATVGIYVNDSNNSAILYSDFDACSIRMYQNKSIYSLVPDRNLIQNNRIHNPVEQHGIRILGCGTVISHNDLDDVTMYIEGPENIVEYNDLDGGTSVTSDSGCIYLGLLETWGTHIRYNYIHNMHIPGCGIYFDDLSSRNYAYYNIIDSTERAPGRSVNLCYTSSGHYNVFYNNICLGRSMDYIHESTLYFDDKQALGYRWVPMVTNMLTAFQTKYNQTNVYRRFPELQSYVNELTENMQNLATSGYVRDEQEIYLRSPANNIVKNNLVLGTNVMFYQTITSLTNSITGERMVSTDLVENNYHERDIEFIFEDAPNGNFTFMTDALEDIRSVVPEFIMPDISTVGRTVK